MVVVSWKSQLDLGLRVDIFFDSQFEFQNRFLEVVGFWSKQFLYEEVFRFFGVILVCGKVGLWCQVLIGVLQFIGVKVVLVKKLCLSVCFLVVVSFVVFVVGFGFTGSVVFMVICVLKLVGVSVFSGEVFFFFGVQEAFLFVRSVVWRRWVFAQEGVEWSFVYL